MPPLILALKLDDESFAYFNGLRKAHFPPAINYLDAHLTLFHHLPDVPAVTGLLRTVAMTQPPITLEVTGLMKLGRGVAFRLESKPLVELQAFLKWQWREWLTPQDQQGFRPHVTVQNKVDPATANALYEELSGAFEPFTAAGTGLSLWEYHNGPWQKREDFGFGS
jgi:2'-5' RNA ligase